MRSATLERRLLVALALLSASACLPVGPGSASYLTSPSARATRAVEALGDEDFATARGELLWLASRCESGELGRRAVLLLAAAELDTENPEGSPRVAAELARSYLVLPDAEPEQIPVARTLYRLAADRGGLIGSGVEPSAPLPVVAVRFDSCEPLAEAVAVPDVPAAPVITNHARMVSLEGELASSTDSIDYLRAENAALRAKVAELEAEIQRISELLKNGIPGLPSGNGR